MIDEGESARRAKTAWLPAHGVSRGTRVALMVRPSLELFSLVFGLFKAGVVPVMIDPGIGLKNMKACLAKARPEAFIGIPTAQVARLVLRWARGSIRRASFPSSVVTESATFTKFFSAIGCNKSRSRNTSADLVTIVNG